MSLFPSIKWAQLDDLVYVTLNVPDVKEPKISIENDKMLFTGASGANKYHCELVFSGEIIAEGSKSKVNLSFYFVFFFVQ
jgi:prostaglandin-E synthase